MGKFSVKIDKNACQGFGACVELCPKFFQISDIDGKSHFKEGEKQVVKEEDELVEKMELEELGCVREAAEACPFHAVHIVNLETGEELV